MAPDEADPNESNEDTTNREYERSLRFEGLTPSTRDVLESNLDDERRHRSWLEERVGEFERPSYVSHP